jgi:antitoxin VapB
LVGISPASTTLNKRACGLSKGLSFAYKLMANEFVFHREDVAISKVRDKTKSAPIEKPPIDFDKFWARLDALGAKDYLPDGIPDDPPVEPDPRVFFDE